MGYVWGCHGSAWWYGAGAVDRLEGSAHGAGETRLWVWVARIAGCDEAAGARADVGVHAPTGMDAQGVGAHRVPVAIGARGLGLTPAIAAHLAAAALLLIPVDGEVLLLSLIHC